MTLPRTRPAVTACGSLRTTCSTAGGRPRTNIVFPSTPDPAFTRPESILHTMGKSVSYHTVFIVKKAAAHAEGTDCVPLFDEHLASLCGDAVLSDLERPQEVDRQQRLCEQPRRSPGVLLLSAAPRGAGDLFRRKPNALAGRGPIYLDGPGRMGLQPPLPAGSVHPNLARGAGLLRTTC